MFAVGHIAIGYLIAKIICRVFNLDLNLPAILTFSLLPDIDLVVPGLLHRGPTHSILFILLISIALLAYLSKPSLPYIAALSTHSLIGDVITDGGVQLLWPFSKEWIQYSYSVTMTSSLEVYLETSLFILLMITMFLSGDLLKFLRPKNSNKLLFIPLATIVLPAMFKYPVSIPQPLIIQHLILLGIVGLSFIISIIIPQDFNLSDKPGDNKIE
jgi:membrane-bound metal-dependent hydrolase YbcI (DUF457 family)